MERAPDNDDAELQALGAAVVNRKRRSYLDAVDAQRRRLQLDLVSNGLLRKPATGQSRSMQRLRDELAAQAREQMRAQHRRPFRGSVAVELDLHAVGVRQPAASPPTVKAYLDLLQGIAYVDDRCIEYLRVTRHARDNPLFRAVPRGWIYSGTTPRFPHGPESHVEVRITVQPLRTYTADVDRLFLLRDEVFGDDYDEAGAEFFASLFDETRDDERLNELLLGGGPGQLDRPGPPPAITRLMWHQHPDRKKYELDDLFGPGRFLLSEPPTAPGRMNWRQEVRQYMAAHHNQWRIRDVMMGAPLALDLAVRPAAGRDLDNLARDVVVPFEEVFCANERGTVASYRVYHAPPETGSSGVRLWVIGDERLEAFERAIRSVRDWLLR